MSDKADKTKPIRELLDSHNRALLEEAEYRRHGNQLISPPSAATGEAIVKYVARLISDHDILDVFYKLSIKERDFARFQVDRLRVEWQAMMVSREVAAPAPEAGQPDSATQPKG
jgi:hypothetical protein